jgi:hypothetical protein
MRNSTAILATTALYAFAVVFSQGVADPVIAPG